MEQYNLLESSVDERDYIYSNICNGIVELPTKYLVDVGEIRNQMGTNHCASYSTVYNCHADAIAKYGEDAKLSPMFVHMNGKKIDKVKDATGCALRDIMKSISTYGVALESDYPSTNLLTNSFPKCSDTVYKKALRYKQDGYAQVSQDVESVKRAIYDNNGCVCHMRLFKDYFNDCWIDKPTKQENNSGSHALCIAGYDDTMKHTYPSGITRTGYFIIVDSYGYATRTNKGYIYLPYDAIRENWRGMYDSPDKMIKEIWTTISNSKVVKPVSMDINSVGFNPNKVIEMVLGSKECFVNGYEMTMDVIPQVINGTTFVPIAFISSTLGHTVRWYGDEKRVNIFAQKLNKNVDMWIGNCKAKNGKEDYYFISPPSIINGKTYIPLRSTEMLNCFVDFDNKTKKITIIEQ